MSQRTRLGGGQVDMSHQAAADRTTQNIRVSTLPPFTLGLGDTGIPQPGRDAMSVRMRSRVIPLRSP